MRKLGLVLALLGGFLLMLGILAKWYAPGQLMRTPLNVDTTTHLDGEATIGSDPAGPVKVTSITRTNSEKSTDDTVVWVNSTCVVKDEGDVPDCVSADDPQKRLVSASVDNFATDRKSALAVNDSKLLPPDAVPHEGIVNKWPFEAEKKTYPYWDGTLNETVDAKFIDTVDFDGLETYQYQVKVDEAPAEVTDGIKGTYTTEKNIYVEPLTGSIVNQTENRVMKTEDGDNVVTLDIEFTDAQKKTSVEESKTNVSSLNLIRSIVPLVGFIVGIPLLLLGLFLTRRKPREKAHA